MMASIHPLGIRSEQEFRISISEATEWKGKTVEVAITGADDVGVMQLGWLTISLDGDGNGEAMFPGISIQRETAIFVDYLGVSPNMQRLETVAISIVGVEGDITDREVMERYTNINKRRGTRYRQPLGSEGPDTSLFRVFFLVEGLLVSRRTDSRHGSLHPLPESVHHGDRKFAVETSLKMLGWPSTVNEDNWKSRVKRSDLVIIEFPTVWAEDWPEADRLAAQEADRIMNSIAFIRQAAPRKVVVVLERDGPPIRCKMRSLDTAYPGNLATGIIAGESQSRFNTVENAVQSDPKISLYISLFLDAQRETGVDTRYFKLWNILETIASNKIPGGERVVLEDGTYWPDGQTTHRAAPRVYELIRGLNVPLKHLPGGNLYTFVRATYGRRNAAAHYGRFIVDEAEQVRQGWYEWALRTIKTGPEPKLWLWNLQNLVHDVIDAQIEET